MRFFRGGQVAIAVVTRALIDGVHATEDDCDDIAGLPGRAEGVVVSVTIRRAARRPQQDLRALEPRGGFVRHLRGLRRRRPQDGLRLHAGVRYGDGRGKDPCSHRSGVARMNGSCWSISPRTGRATTSWPSSAACSASGAWAIPARSTRWRPACWSCSPGRATRAVSFSENHSKCYEARLRLGLTTDTQDTTGTVLETHPVTVGADEVRAALEHFTGELLQLPPMYSALKVNGQKLYDLARRARPWSASRAPSPFTSWSCWSSPHRTNLPARGVLQGDLHPHALPRSRTGARLRRRMAALRRTMAAGFRIEEAVTLERGAGGARGPAPAAGRIFPCLPALYRAE